ncbi:MAG: hypothetical protein JJE49_03280 [Peptostreptococcaceae bacterium]|nr:hypothetical protein [Peptostreptococcaceae bacterium]
MKGVEVVYYVDETAKALGDLKIRKEFIKRFTHKGQMPMVLSDLLRRF